MIFKKPKKTETESEEFCKLRSKFKNHLYIMSSYEFDRFWELRCILVDKEPDRKLKKAIDYNIIF